MAAVSDIYRAANVIRHHMEQKVLADEDLSWAAFTVLFVLWIWGDQRTRHLAAEAGVTKGTLTGVLKTLEKRASPGGGRTTRTAGWCSSASSPRESA
jgi:MarR family transcriptional regulator, organic hydroperoxide resistance regulator